MTRILLALAALSLSAVPAHAADEVSIETFDDREIGLTSFNIYNSAFMFNTKISGGTVSKGTIDYPAHSPEHVYGGRSITLVTEVEADFSWPG
ncbi:MAG TPA: hypothetical protein VNT42_14210, partial [Sphingomonas sp.]|nr:hypothetical protein [Sphingomonas sp.]